MVGLAWQNAPKSRTCPSRSLVVWDPGASREDLLMPRCAATLIDLLVGCDPNEDAFAERTTA